MKRKDWIIIFTMFVICFLGSCLVSVAATGNLFDSNEVSYDNTSSGMSSTNVKAAVDELYAAASDYSNINSRVTTLENYFDNGSSTSYFENDNLWIAGNATTTSSGAWIEFMVNGKDRLGVGVHNTGDSVIATKSESGTVGGSELSIYGTPIKLNGVDVTSVYNSPDLTINTTNAGGGNIWYIKIGKLVIVNLNSMYPKVSGKNPIATGLPTAARTALGHLTNDCAVVIEGGSGTLQWYWTGTTTSGGHGQIVYISQS